MQERKKPTRGRPQGAKTFDPAPALAFGSAVKARRLELGISQENLAGAAQVERSHMGKVERGAKVNLVLLVPIVRRQNLFVANALLRRLVNLVERNLLLGIQG